jgi:hypothetical protein
MVPVDAVHVLLPAACCSQVKLASFLDSTKNEVSWPTIIVRSCGAAAISGVVAPPTSPDPPPPHAASAAAIATLHTWRLRRIQARV